MEAWLYERKLTDEAVPPALQENNEEDWMSYVREGRASDNRLFNDWISSVPGSKAPCDVAVAAIQSMDNRGYDVSEAEQYIGDGLRAAREKDGAALQVITAKIYAALNRAPKREGNEYDKYTVYLDFAQVAERVNFLEAAACDVTG